MFKSKLNLVKENPVMSICASCGEGAGVCAVCQNGCSDSCTGHCTTACSHQCAANCVSSCAVVCMMKCANGPGWQTLIELFKNELTPSFIL